MGTRNRQHIASVCELIPEAAQRYLELHKQIPHAVSASMWRANMRDYTIFIDAESKRLFGKWTYVGDDFDGDMSKLSSLPHVQDWIATTSECQKLSSDGANWTKLEKIYEFELAVPEVSFGERSLLNKSMDLTTASFGTASIAGLYREVSADNAAATLSAAWDVGIRYFDTAPWYGAGLGEHRLGEFLRNKPLDEFVVSTKVGRLLEPVHSGQADFHGFVGALPFNVRMDYSYDGIMRSFEDSLQRLGLPRVDIVYVHDIASWPDDDLNRDQLREFFDGGGLRALEELKANSVIKAFGLGVNFAQVCVEVMRRTNLDVNLLAGRYTLLDRSAECELLDLCVEQECSLVIGGVYNSGILATGPVEGAHFNYEAASPEVKKKVAALQALALSHGMTLPEAAIRFPLSNPVVASVLVGTADPVRLLSNVSDFSGSLSDEFLIAASENTLSWTG